MQRVAGPCHRSRVTSRVRVVGRRVVVVAVVVLQLGFVARGYWSDHKEFAFQMFPESSTWRADVVRVTADGRRVPIERPWSGYRWDELVQNRGLSYPCDPPPRGRRARQPAGVSRRRARLGRRQHPARRRDPLPGGPGDVLAQRRPAPGRGPPEPTSARARSERGRGRRAVPQPRRGRRASTSCSAVRSACGPSRC